MFLSATLSQPAGSPRRMCVILPVNVNAVPVSALFLIMDNNVYESFSYKVGYYFYERCKYFVCECKSRPKMDTRVLRKCLL